MSSIIAPSILASDFSRLGEEIRMINESEADWIHVDIMDGVFVPNISMGIPVVQAVKRHAKKPMDVHLMIVQPERYIEAFRDAGAAIVSVHLEACPHLHRTLQHIKDAGCKAGVAVNPHTPISALEDVASDLDLVCLMSVNPGFGGQKFIPNTYKKIADLIKLREQTNGHFQIEIDGGVNSDNAVKLLKEGADVLVAGNFVFSAADPKKVIADLKRTSH
ncbi:MAG: ribulose-phosphate 3-epimerase [Cyclobacteriaceae bacterium]